MAMEPLVSSTTTVASVAARPTAPAPAPSATASQDRAMSSSTSTLMRSPVTGSNSRALPAVSPDTPSL